jgi:hypothetical protein
MKAEPRRRASRDPAKAGESSTIPTTPPEGGEGRSQDRGDSNRSPRQQQQAPGRPPQRQQGGSQWNRSINEDPDDEGDTRPNTSVDDNSASRN